MKKVLIQLLKAYKRFISPYATKSCRFYPTCSEYAAEALDEFGIFKGTALSVWRILRCNPFSGGGYDPVIKEMRER